ncbi:hypothetical protein ACIQNU_18920 [Streptomyces sp. NPDC091292]|uniref:hypothetical protein n=1 Tax=Streptomyces sp. NPDC091292 TaxID=3365991 RepID=UPI003803CDEC
MGIKDQFNEKAEQIKDKAQRAAGDAKERGQQEAHQHGRPPQDRDQDRDQARDQAQHGREQGQDMRDDRDERSER